MKNKDRFLCKTNYDLFLYFYFFFHELIWKSLLKRGQKIKQINFFLSFKYELKLRQENDPYLILIIAFLNIMPVLYSKKIWLGGINRIMGFPIKLEKQVKIGVSWILKNAKEKKKSINLDKFIDSIILSLNESGEIWNKKKELYEISIENRLFFKYFK